MKPASVLSEKINQHPLLKSTDKIFQDSPHYLDFVNLLMEYFHYDAQVSKHARSLAEEEEWLRTQLPRTKTDDYNLHFDSVVFMEALNSSLKSFDPQKGTFLSLFRKVYRRIFTQEMFQEQGYAENKLMNSIESERKLRQEVAPIMQFLRQRGLTLDRMTDELCRLCADATGLTQANVKKLILCLHRKNVVSLDEPIQSGENETVGSLLDTLAETSVFPQSYANYYGAVVQILEVICTKTDREYNRYFLSNSLLSQVEESADFCCFLQNDEAFLWQKILLVEYCTFVYSHPPTPDSLERILRAQRLRPLKNPTIAAFLNRPLEDIMREYNRFRRTLSKPEFRELMLSLVG